LKTTDNTLLLLYSTECSLVSRNHARPCLSPAQSKHVISEESLVGSLLGPDCSMMEIFSDAKEKEEVARVVNHHTQVS
jgi:hypothetical protein